MYLWDNRDQTIISALFALVICGLIYLRMIKREVPEPIGKLQAILPVTLGGICVLVSGPAGIGLLYAFKNIGVTGETMATLPASFLQPSLWREEWRNCLSFLQS